MQKDIKLSSSLFHLLEKISHQDLQRVDMPSIKTPKYATTVFRVKGVGER